MKLIIELSVLSTIGATVAVGFFAVLLSFVS